MQIDPRKIRYLRLVADRSSLSLADTRQLGERIDSVAVRFALHPDLEDLHLG